MMSIIPFIMAALWIVPATDVNRTVECYGNSYWLDEDTHYCQVRVDIQSGSTTYYIGYFTSPEGQFAEYAIFPGGTVYENLHWINHHDVDGNKTIEYWLGAWA